MASCNTAYTSVPQVNTIVQLYQNPSTRSTAYLTFQSFSLANQALVVSYLSQPDCADLMNATLDLIHTATLQSPSFSLSALLSQLPPSVATTVSQLYSAKYGGGGGGDTTGCDAYKLDTNATNIVYFAQNPTPGQTPFQYLIGTPQQRANTLTALLIPGCPQIVGIGIDVMTQMIQNYPQAPAVIQAMPLTVQAFAVEQLMSGYQAGKNDYLNSSIFVLKNTNNASSLYSTIDPVYLSALFSNLQPPVYPNAESVLLTNLTLSQLINALLTNPKSNTSELYALYQKLTTADQATMYQSLPPAQQNNLFLLLSKNGGAIKYDTSTSTLTQGNTTTDNTKGAFNGPDYALFNNTSNQGNSVYLSNGTPTILYNTSANTIVVQVVDASSGSPYSGSASSGITLTPLTTSNDVYLVQTSLDNLLLPLSGIGGTKWFELTNLQSGWNNQLLMIAPEQYPAVTSNPDDSLYTLLMAQPNDNITGNVSTVNDCPILNGVTATLPIGTNISSIVDPISGLNGPFNVCRYNKKDLLQNITGVTLQTFTSNFIDFPQKFLGSIPVSYNLADMVKYNIKCPLTGCPVTNVVSASSAQQEISNYYCYNAPTPGTNQTPCPPGTSCINMQNDPYCKTWVGLIGLSGANPTNSAPLSDYCSQPENMLTDLCKEYCADPTTNCDVGYTKVCSNLCQTGNVYGTTLPLPNGTCPTGTILNPDPAGAGVCVGLSGVSGTSVCPYFELVSQIDACGCFLPNAFYQNYYNSLTSQVANVVINTEQKECTYGLCASSNIKPFSVKTEIAKNVQVCPNINQCISNVNVDNNGTVGGNININSSAQCTSVFNTKQVSYTVSYDVPTQSLTISGGNIPSTSYPPLVLSNTQPTLFGLELPQGYTFKVYSDKALSTPYSSGISGQKTQGVMTFAPPSATTSTTVYYYTVDGTNSGTINFASVTPPNPVNPSNPVTPVNPPNPSSGSSTWNKITDWSKKYWWVILIGVIVFILLVVLIVRALRKK